MHPIFFTALWKGAAVLCAAFAIEFALRKASAAMRHLAWTAALLSLPVVTFFAPNLPGWRVPVVDRIDAVATFAIETFARPQNGAVAKGAVSIAPGTPGIGWLPLVWCAGAVFFLMRLSAGFFAVRRIARGARAWRRVEGVPVLLATSEIMPMAVGTVRPAILLPVSAEGWEEERREMVIRHEIAHVRRRDGLTHLLAQLVCALYWFQPLVWLAQRRMLRHRERAADDFVIAGGARPSDYAATLLDVARSLRPFSAAAAMARRSEVEGRMLAILDSGLQRGAARPVHVAAAAAAAMALVLPLAAMRPQGPQTAAESEETLQADLERAAPDSVEAGRILSRLSRLETKNSQEYAARALPILEKAFGPNSPELADPLYVLAIAAQAGRNVERAEALYRRALALRPSAGIAASLGQLLQLSRREGEAEPLYQQALAQDPNFGPALDLYASLLTATGRGAEAVPLANRAQEAHARNVAQTAPYSGGQAQKVSAGGLERPKLLSKVEPEYTNFARAAKVHGTVVLGVVVGTDGKAVGYSLKRGIGYGLDEAAVEAISQWTFQPATRGGVPVPVQATIEVNFRLL